MKHNPCPRVVVATLVLSLSFAGSVGAQTCGAGQTLMKNDNLPAVLVYPWQANAISSIGAGDAAACVFDFSAVAPVIQVSSVAVGFINSFGGAMGIQAPANLEIYDGLAWNGNIPVLGPSVFDYGASTGGATVTLTTSAINVIDVSGFGIRACSGKLVIAWRMLVGNLGSTNISADCPGGGGFGCSPATTPPMKNLVYRAATGWRDVTATTYNGLPFCPFNYCGNWQIRTCIAPAPFPDTISISGSPIHSPGTGNVLFHFPGHANMGYVGAAALTAYPGIPTPVGTVPLTLDALLTYSLSTPSVFPGFSGLLDASGNATGAILVPAGVGPVTAYIAAVALHPGTGQILAITNAASVGVW